MKQLVNLIHCVFCLIFLWGCNANDSFFLQKIENDPGNLTILNESGFIGASAVGNTLDHELILYASGGLELTNISVQLITSDPFTYKGEVYPGEGGTCGNRLASGQRCSIIIRYAPTVLASHRADLKITYQDKLKTKSLDYTLTADSHPILSFEYGTLYNFGNKFVGSSTDLKIRITNKGKVPAQNISINNMIAPFSFKGGSYPGAGGDCTTQLNPGGACDIVMNYLPGGNGEHLQDITLNYKNTGNTETSTLNLKAWGFYPAHLTLSSVGGLGWGEIATGESTDKVFLVTHQSGDVEGSALDLKNLDTPFSFKGGSFPGTGGTCPRILTKQVGSCTIVLTANSASSGVWSNQILLSYINGKELIQTAYNLSATSKQKAVLSFSPTGTIDWGIVAKGGALTKTFTVTYESGELPATNLQIENLAAPFTRVGGSCGTTLSSGTCTIDVRYSPTDYSSSNLTSRISYWDGNVTKKSSDLNLTGKSEGSFSFYYYAQNFGNVVVGQTKIANLVFRYYGGAPVTGLNNLTVTGPFSLAGPFPGSGGNCTDTFSSSGGYCSLALQFTPTIEGSQSGQLTINYHDGLINKTLTQPLSGVGTPVATLSIDNYDFGTAGLNSDTLGKIRIRNTGSKEATSLTSLALPSGFLYRGGSFPGAGGTCSTTLSGGSTCELWVLFRPSEAKAYSSSLSLTYHNGVGTSSITSNVSGVGVTTSELYISDVDTVSLIMSFAEHPKDVTFTLSHGGGGTPVTIISKSLVSSDFSILSDSCGASLSNGASCSIIVRFLPATIGTKSANLSVSYNNGGDKVTTRALSGTTNTAPMKIVATPTSYDFGAQPYGETYEQVVTLNRSGYASLYTMTPSLTGTGFVYKGGSYPGTGGTCTTRFNVLTSCTIVVQFKPTAVQNYTGEFKLIFNDGVDNHQLSVPFTGSGKPKGILSISSANFGKIIQTQKVIREIDVTYNGTVPVTDIHLEPLSPPFYYTDGNNKCGTELSSGTCKLYVEYRPTSVAVENKPLTLSYNNGSFLTTATGTLTAESVAQAIVSISESAVYPFGTVNVGGTIDKVFQVMNAGGVAATQLAGAFASPVFKFKGGSFPGTGGNCTTTLNAAGTCEIVLSFEPAQAQNYTGMFTLNYHDGLHAQIEQKELRGVGSLTLAKQFYLSQIQPYSFYVSELNTFDVREFTTRGNTYLILSQAYELEQFEKISLGDLNRNNSQDNLYVMSTRQMNRKELFIAYDNLEEKILYRIPNLLGADWHQGRAVVRLKKDLNGDGVSDFLVGIYKREAEQFILKGYEIFCARTGRTIEKYLAH